MTININQNVAYRYLGSDRAFRFFTTPKLIEGTHKIAIVVEDVAGNQSAATIVERALDYFPSSVTSFTATYNAGPKTVTLTWVDPTNSDLSTLRIFQGKGTNVLAPDYEIEIGNVGSGVLTFTTGALTDDDYIFGIRAEDSSANLETNVNILVRVNVPNAAIPFKIGFESDIEDTSDDEIVLVGVPQPSGVVKLEWEYFEDKANAIVTIFKIYSDNGDGIVDFSSAIGSLVRNSSTLDTIHTFTSGTLTTDAKRKFKFVVRAETAAGVDDRNVDFIEVDLFGQAPMIVENVSSEVLRALNSENGFLTADELIDDDFDFEYADEFA